MEAYPPAWEHQPWMWECPQPNVPPGLNLNPQLAWTCAMDNVPALCLPAYAPGYQATGAYPPAWEHQPWMWEHPQPSMLPPVLEHQLAWACAMDNVPVLCLPAYAPGYQGMEAYPPPWQYQLWMWEGPQPSIPPGLNPQLAWACAMDNVPVLCLPSCAPGHQGMEAYPPAWEHQPWMWEPPQPSMLPGLNPQLDCSWVMGNFPALCLPSCTPGLQSDNAPTVPTGCCAAMAPGAGMSLEPRGARQKHCGDPRVHHPKAESSKNQQSPQGDASATSEGHTDAPGAALSPSPPLQAAENPGLTQEIPRQKATHPAPHRSRAPTPCKEPT